MPTEPHHRSSFAAPRHAVSAIGLATGILVLSLALPRTIAAFQLLPGNPVLDTIRLGEDVSDDDMETLIGSRLGALEWTRSGRIHGDLALVYLESAEREGFGGGATGEGHLRAGLRALKVELSLSPADPFAWARLAFVRIKGGGSAADVKRALFLSFLTGPHEKRLALSRIQYAILLWNRLNTDERSLVLDQISWADRIGNRRSLVEMAKRDRKAAAVIFQALARDPTRLRGYLQNLNE